MLDKVIDGIEDAVKKSAKHLDDSMTRGIKQMAKNHRDNDKGLADHFKGLGKDGKKDPKGPNSGSGTKGLPHSPHTGNGQTTANGSGKPGQASHGNRRCQTAGDPVDVVSGQMVMSDIDLELPGLLPLVVRRAYASGYAGGRWFGPGWSSTLDQRVQVGADGIHYVGEDAEILHYPRPSRPGEEVLPSEGARWPLTWDSDTDTIMIEDPETGWTRHFNAFPEAGALRPISALSDRNGDRVEYLADADDLPTELRHSGGYRVMVDTVHTAAGPRIEALRLLDGTNNGLGTTVMTYGYDIRGRLTEIIDSSGVALIYDHDTRDRLTSWTDRDGFWYRYDYGTDSRVCRAHGSEDVLTATFAYDLQQRVTTVTDSLGNRRHYYYDENHHITRTVDALGHTVRTEYDRYGRLLSRTDELGHTTRYILDANGDPLRIDRPDGTSETAVYNELRLPVEITGADGQIWRYTYDAHGSLLSTVDPLGAVTTYSYDKHGRLATVTDPLGSVRRHETDRAGLPVAVIDPLGAVTRVTRDAFGRVVSVTDPLGGITRMGWTVEGKPAWRVGADGAREEWQCDANGNLVRHLGPGTGAVTFEYGPFGQVTARTDADGTRYDFCYDQEMRLISVRNPRGQVWRYTYDAAGRLTAESDFNGSTLTYRNDPAGRPIERTNACGQIVRLTRDPEGRVLVREADGTTPVTFRYDALGRLLEASSDSVVVFERDAVGRILRETVDGRSVTNQYDLAGRRVRRTTPTGAISEWTYDTNGLPRTLATLGGGLSFGRDLAGRETTRYLGQGAALTQTWDAAHRLTAQSVWSKVPAADESPAHYNPLQQRTYVYRADGNPTAVTDTARGNRSYGLDAVGRVTLVQAADWTEEYAYDALGNITMATGQAESAKDTSGERLFSGTLVRSAGRASYEHDSQGRMVKEIRRTLSGRVLERVFEWDAYDRLVRTRTIGGQTWEYHYDPLGRRIAKQRTDVNSPAIIFSWDEDCLAEQTSISAEGRTVVTTWDWEPGEYRPTSQLHRSWVADATQAEIDQRFYAIVTDAVGAPSELVTPDGRIAWYTTTDVWGSTVTGGGTETDCPLRFPGQYRDDETGLNYNYHRYYDPEIGRYISPDPLGLAPALNHHAYVDNPLCQLDPLGLARAKRLRPDPDATGPHTTFRRDGTTGQVTHYAEWGPQDNPRDPAPWKMTKRADMVGPAHYDRTTGETIPTPHVNLPDGSARPTEPWENTPCP
ncbi:RHS repeat-associated core domain-containing protein [Streptomyces rimosus]|uniref:RHS repeat-associated core domain-containing protein n=1 Tax=Streptomyces rimosus TaxID=1927 RepID=UPI0031D18F1B